jgi:hypothetical protein
MVDNEPKTPIILSKNDPKTVEIQGILRKKGLVFYNERIVRITSQGILSYYEKDKPKLAKVQINLRHIRTSVKIVYAGR